MSTWGFFQKHFDPKHFNNAYQIISKQFILNIIEKKTLITDESFTIKPVAFIKKINNKKMLLSLNTHNNH